MSLIADLVQQTATATGAGNLGLADVDGRQSFNDAFGVGPSFYYFVMHRSAAEWEVGSGHLSDASTLVRDAVLASSNSNLAVAFSSGTKDVTNDVPAGYQPLLEQSSGVFFQRSAAISGNAVPWGHLVNRNNFDDGSGVGGENYVNEVAALGWNVSAVVGVPAVASKAMLWDGWEYKYNSGGVYGLERHMESLDTAGTQHRFFSWFIPHAGASEAASGQMKFSTFGFCKWSTGAQIVKWDLANNCVFFGIGKVDFPILWEKNGVAVARQRNAADTAYLKLPYIKANDKLEIETQIEATPASPSAGQSGVQWAFQGAPGHGSSLFAVSAGAAGNATVQAFAATVSTDWNLQLYLRNSSTAANSESHVVVATDAASAWAHIRFEKSDASVQWSVGKDRSGHFGIGNGERPDSSRILKIENTTRWVTFTPTSPTAGYAAFTIDLGTPAHSSLGVSITSGVDAGNASINALNIKGKTNWTWVATIHNWSTTAGSDAKFLVKSDAAAGYAHGSFYTPSGEWSGGIDTSGYYAIGAGPKPDVNTRLRINNSTPSITLYAHLLFSPDSTYDIGASGATRPRTIYAAQSVANYYTAGVQFVGPSNRFRLADGGADGTLKMLNSGETSFDRLMFGGATSSFPALKRSSAVLETKLADDSAYAQHNMLIAALVDGVTAPTATAGLAKIYVDTADGDLKIIFGDGTVKTIVVDT